MNQQSKWFAVALTVACSLTVIGSAPAQGVVNFSTIDTTSLGGWSGATFTAGSPAGSANSSGLEVVAPSSAYGSTYVNIGGVALDASDVEAILTFTVNGNASSYNWMGTTLQLNDNTSSKPVYGAYSGSGNPGNPVNAVWNGNSATITFALTGAQLTTVQAGGDYLYGFNLGLDPNTGATPTPNIDVTFNSLTLSPAATPEPASLALAGLGAISLLAFRRGK